MLPPANPQAEIGRTVCLHGGLRGIPSGAKGVIYAIIRNRPQVRFTRKDGDPAMWGVDWSMISPLDA